MVTIVNDGLTAIAKLINGTDSVAYFSYMALGSGSTAEANDQTALVTEITTNGGGRAAATCSYESDYKAKWVKTYTFTGSLGINEMGLFNAASTGTMLLRHKFASQKNVEDTETLQITVKVTVARAS